MWYGERHPLLFSAHVVIKPVEEPHQVCQPSQVSGPVQAASHTIQAGRRAVERAQTSSGH